MAIVKNTYRLQKSTNARKSGGKLICTRDPSMISFIEKWLLKRKGDDIMPRGDASRLDPVRTNEEAKKRGRNGGIASGKARRNKALLRDCLEILMEKKMDAKDGDKKITGAEALSVDLFLAALNETDTAKKAKAFEVLRDTAGQKPVDKIEQTNANIVIDLGDLDDND